MPANQETTLQTWTVKEGETMNFEAKFDTDQSSRDNNAIWLYLFANGRRVARSNDSGNGKADNPNLNMFYRAKASAGDVEYRLFAKPSWKDSSITPKHFQMAYTTYGSGHAWHRCMIDEPEFGECSSSSHCTGDRYCDR